MAKISIIILTYNSSAYILNLIKSLISLRDEFEIIVVDNASTDDTLKLVESSGLKVQKVIKLPKNIGFAGGINAGAKVSSGEYLLFLNPDTVFEHGTIKDLLKIYEKNEKVGIVGGKMIDENGNPERSAGRFFNLFEVLITVLGLDEVFGVRFSPKKFTKVDFVSGGFMMVKKDLFEKLRGFDEKFFMYVEDMEFCFRAKKIGINTYFTPNAVVSHKGQGSSNRGFAIIHIYKGLLYFYRKHKSNIQFKIVKFLLQSKALTIYMLGRMTNNSYYTQAYKNALTGINNL